MTLSIDHATKVISIPQADLTLIGGTLYELDTEVVFRLGVLALFDDEAGMVLEDAISHNTEVTVAGVTFARTIEIINGFSVTFTPDAQYTVRLVGSNNNLFDVENNILNQNQVQVISQNSAGLIVKAFGSGLSVGEQAKLDDLWKLQGLDIANPMTVTPASRDAGAGVSQTITGDGKTTTTVTRDP